MVDTPSAAVIARGEILHRKSLRWGLIALAGLVLALPCAIWARTILMAMATLGPRGFKFAAAAWAFALAAGPVLFLGGGLTALFLRVEAAVAPRNQVRRLGDTLALLCALLITFAPALAALVPPVHALFASTIGFRGLGQIYPRASDPYGFWQAVAFWFMGAATLGYLAVVYWRWKLRQFRGLSAAAAPAATPVAEVEAQV